MDLKKKDPNNAKIASASKGTGGWVDIRTHVHPDMLIQDFGGTFEFVWDFDTYWKCMEML
jgi:hypothetical protein